MRELDITGILALGNGERCPFCKKDDENVFIMQPDKDFIAHCVKHHPNELNRVLFENKPKIKLWLEQPFVTMLARVAAKLRMIEQPDRISDEEYELQMEAIYSIITEWKNESD